MNKCLDEFIDSREKRYHLTLCCLFLGWMLVSISYLYVGIKLIQVQDYDQVFALLDHQGIYYCFSARFIVSLLSLGVKSFWNVVALMFQSISVLEVFVIVCSLFCFHYIMEHKYSWIVALLLFVVNLVIVTCLVGGLLSKTLLQAILYLRGLGFALIIVFSILLIVFVIGLFRHGKQYLEALQYQVIEYKENELD